MPDAATIGYISGGLGAILLALATWAWGHTHKRIDEAWKEVDKKASNDELTRVRNTQAEIFNQFREHEAEDRSRHTELVGKMGRVEGKLELILDELRNNKGRR